VQLAIVHDYLNQFGGAEQVVSAMRKVYPSAPIYTSLYRPDRLPAEFRDWPVTTSFLQRLPLQRWFRLYLPLYPLAFRSFDLTAYDVVLSSSSAFGKGARKRPDACHICYVHSPMRFAWQPKTYFAHTRVPRALQLALSPLFWRLRRWDVAATRGIDRIIANSWNVAQRIQTCYDREPDAILHPPCDCDRFAIAQPEDYFLVISRLRAYKRVDRAVTACSEAGVRLEVIGEGDDRPRLEQLAGPTVRFLGPVSQETLSAKLSGCRALIFPGEEDFGIVPVEAMASGRPVIAFGRGGALESVLPANGYPDDIAGHPALARAFDEPTGILFSETAELTALLRDFDDGAFRPESLRAHALQFDRPAFGEQLERLVAGFAGV